MEKFFNPSSIVIFGLSTKKHNIPSYIVQNTRQWGYQGAIYGVSPGAAGEESNGATIYGSLSDLPAVPDLAVLLIPARHVPKALEECGKFGITRATVQASGFNELSESGGDLARQLNDIAGRYGMRFMGPNGLAVSNAHSGVFLPFIPNRPMAKGGFSFVSQSGGLCYVLWNMMHDENVGMAKFASIGNKLNVDEVDVLEYLGRDPQTEVIGLYLESIANGERLVEAARRIRKPVIALKANRSAAGARAAMSHTASMSNDDDIVNAAFERAGIIRIEDVREFVSLAKAFKLPPMRGNRLMIMTPGGGAGVMMADQCEKYGFDLADPGAEFYESLHAHTNAGVIRFSNPLDMGDIYDITAYPRIFRDALSRDGVDAAVYGHPFPLLPKDDGSIFKPLYYTDISGGIAETISATGKPLAMCVSSTFEKYVDLNAACGFPVYAWSEEVIRSLRTQADFYARQAASDEIEPVSVHGQEEVALRVLMRGKSGSIGEEMLDVLRVAGFATADSSPAESTEDAVQASRALGYPVVMKIDSPDILHKSDSGGVITEIENDLEAGDAFGKIVSNARAHHPGARIRGVRVAKMAPRGHDMFVGAVRDGSFGPVLVFGYGGIYTEVFKDVARVMCPASPREIREKLGKLKCGAILEGIRGGGRADILAFSDAAAKISRLMAMHPGVRELDLNPVRVFGEGEGVMVLDARASID